MQFLAVLFFAALASAAAVPEPAYHIAQPGSPIKRAEATFGPLEIDTSASTTASTTTPIATVTDAPAADAAANAMRVNDPDYESSSSACTPSSICFDGITCGIRYGGCYDKNSCTGTASWPMPTCTDDPSAGLTQNMMKRAKAAAAVEQ